MSRLRKTLDLIETEGAAVTVRYCVSYLARALLGARLLTIEDIRYRRWRRKHALSGSTLQSMKTEVDDFPYRPLISIIMPVFDTDPEMLRRAIESVEAQVYPNWELCLADDCSTRADTKAEIEKLSVPGGKIKMKALSQNAGIAGASNVAIGLAEGEFIALLDHDDELAPDALFEAVKLLNECRDADMIYSDEDKLDERGRHVEAYLKPDWAPEQLLSNMYTCHLGIYRKTLIDEIGGFREGFDGAQDYDLVLRLTERTDKIHHIPKVLYHWRMSSGSTASDYSNQGETKTPEMSSLKALKDAMERRRIEGVVEGGLFAGSYRVRPAIKNDPLVTIMIPTRDNLGYLRKCIQSIDENDYRNFELIVVNNRSEQPETLEFLDAIAARENGRVLEYNEQYDFSRINNLAASHANGSYLLLLNSDTESIQSGWLTAMLEAVQIPGVGVVGSKLLYPDDTIQHAGIVLWRCGPAGHLHSRLPRDNHGYFGIVDIMRNCSAVTAACMLVRKNLYDDLGGLDVELPVAYQEVDLCLRALECGYRTVYTPFSLLYHHESVVTGPRVDTHDENIFRGKWEKRMPVDRFHNPNFPPYRLDFRLE